ncbi:MAG TPA: TIGR04295 family B12-binding domain-containing radical SAM protein [Polyangia bacterium]|nr:TIGR04295 family B12-binding domain-containing radical SAM protein [Polyangia bacterium]
MKLALVNPPWTFDGSIYFGCRQPHLPLEVGYAQALLQAAGHTAEIVDAHLEGLEAAQLRARVERLQPDAVVVTTAPTYLFWRCPPPELRVPAATIAALRDLAPVTIAVGPHGSTTPAAALRKLDADVVVMGECEEALVDLASTPVADWGGIPGLALRAGGGRVAVNGGPRAVDMARLPPLRWPAELVARHSHHHHRFDGQPDGPGAEMEASRGCPYHCTFCAKDNYRDKYRKRPLATILDELDGLIAAGARYVYFVDEIFLPDERLLREIAARDIGFGVQTRIDLWSFELLDLLGAAGCRSIEAGVESISAEGRAQLDKRCKLSTDDLARRLSHAKRVVPFVQATLMESKADDPAAVAAWRKQLMADGVWANEPVPLFPYPGSPDYTRLWGPPDEQAWERAHDHYLGSFDSFSDVQEKRPVRLRVLEGHAE